MEIRHYTPELKREVLSLFSEEYGVTIEAFGKIFDALYNHPVQEGKCILLVAIDQNEVAGFQSYMYWPYASSEGKMYNAYQSGNSIVGKKHRGKGVFTKLLRALDSDFLDLDFDFMVGFPVEESYGAFIKCGWSHPFDIKWYVSLNKPIKGYFLRNNRDQFNQWSPLSADYTNQSSQAFEVLITPEFDDYRSKLRPDIHHRLMYKTSDAKTWLVDCKIILRGKFLSECIIGKVTSPGENPNHNHINEIAKAVKSRIPASIVSIALPEQSAIPVPNGFRGINRSFHFIFKSGKVNWSEIEGSLINIGRSDIDTW
jgi:hypothetical protein